eukprot:scaffold20587_cov110-Isochrysis_galbana.AAC.12
MGWDVSDMRLVLVLMRLRPGVGWCVMCARARRGRRLGVGASRGSCSLTDHWSDHWHRIPGGVARWRWAGGRRSPLSLTPLPCDAPPYHVPPSGGHREKTSRRPRDSSSRKFRVRAMAMAMARPRY